MIEKFNIKDLEEPAFIYSVLGLLMLISPGIALVYIHLNYLFIQLDWIKTILLSLAISMPMLCICLLRAISEELDSIRKREGKVSGTFIFAIIMSGTYIYLALLAAYINLSSITNAYFTIFGWNVIFFLWKWNGMSAKVSKVWNSIFSRGRSKKINEL